MHRERIADDVYVFTSGLYAQVTASAIVTREGAVVIDTLPFPGETRQIIDFLAARCPGGIRYLILTHYHVDHTLGASLFKGVPIIAHALCREMLAERGPAALLRAREQNPELAEVSLRLPDIVFDGGELTVRLGNKQMVLMHLPGHSPDIVSVYLKEDKILFATDVVTPVPIIVDGDPRQLIVSLKRARTLSLESIIQGHGEMILRGEINESINTSVNYLNRIMALVAGSIREGRPRDALREYNIESCGKSRIPLHGLVQQFHLANLYSLHDRMRTDAELRRQGLRLAAERESAHSESGTLGQAKTHRPAQKKTKTAAKTGRRPPDRRQPRSPGR